MKIIKCFCTPQGVLIVGLMVVIACSKNKTTYSESSAEISTRQIGESITVKDLHDLMKDSGPVQLIDVRTPEEVETGKIQAGALHYDVQNASFDQDIQNLDRNNTYFLYCKAGKRSSLAQAKMKKLGFTQVVNVQGGVSAWTDAGFSLE